MQKMPARAFAGWIAFLRAEHRGVEREDRRFGELWALLANVNRDTSKRRTPFVWTDLFPEHRRRVRLDRLAEAREMFRQGMAVGASLGFRPGKGR